MIKSKQEKEIINFVIYKVLRLIIRECLQERIILICFPIVGFTLLQMQHNEIFLKKAKPPIGGFAVFNAGGTRRIPVPIEN